MRWRDQDEVAALLTGIAALRLGDERAAAIGEELRERAGQLWRLASDEERALEPPGGPLAVEVMDACRRRIERLEPTLRAWAALDLEGAERAAAELDLARAGDGAMPLAGMPVGVKDVFATAGLPTRAGSELPVDWLGLAGTWAGGGDAAAVARLRRAGAVVVGKTACTELALNDPAPTRSPWNPSRTPGGSSAGSAVAVATGMCVASLDTQTAGDVLRPAAYNGVVGFKPSHGAVPRQGMVPVAWTIDAVGVQARRVGDVVGLFAALTGRGQGRSAGAGTRAAGGAVRGGPPRLGVVRDPLLDRADDEVQRATERALDELRGAGAGTTEVRLDGALELALAAHRVVVFCECAAVHEGLLAQHAERLGPRARTLLELGTVTPATDYLRARRLRRRLAGRLQAALDGVDALLTPTTSGPAPADLDSTGDPSFQIPWTFAGLPVISLPIGLGERGMPLAVQLAGPRGADERLLEVARWCERALDVSLRPSGGNPPPEDG